MTESTDDTSSWGEIEESAGGAAGEAVRGRSEVWSRTESTGGGNARGAARGRSKVWSRTSFTASGGARGETEESIGGIGRIVEGSRD